MRAVIFFFVLMTSMAAAANRCDVFSKINDAGLGDNAKFWEEFAVLSAKGEVPEEQILRLMEKHKAGAGSTPVPAAAAPAAASSGAAPRAFLAGKQRTDIRRDAEKGYNRAPPQVQHKADELVELFNEKGQNAIQDLRNHGWNYERINELGGKYSVRLNQGYRAIVSVEGDKLTVWDIGKHVYQH